jgi:hypothetical protein
MFLRMWPFRFEAFRRHVDRICTGIDQDRLRTLEHGHPELIQRILRNALPDNESKEAIKQANITPAAHTRMAVSPLDVLEFGSGEAGEIWEAASFWNGFCGRPEG